MPEPNNFAKARLEEIRWDANGQVQEIPEEDRKVVPIQFNPQSLKVAFTNQRAGGDQRAGAPIQFIGRGTTRLSLELIFDVTVNRENLAQNEKNDVRQLTKEVTYFITPKGQDYIPPGVRFSWGSFLFEGVMDSMNENLEFFSADGRPLRASVSISFSRQEIQFKRKPIPANAHGAEVASVGTRPQEIARAGDTVQGIASRADCPRDWKNIAAANDIENPRRLGAGTPLNLNPPRSR